MAVKATFTGVQAVACCCDQYLDLVIRVMFRYWKDISDEQVSDARKCNEDGSEMQFLCSYPTAPTIIVKCWEDV